MVENNRKIRIKSSSEGIHELEAFIEDICHEYNIMNSYYSNIQLALNEAYFNAYLHGNKSDHSKWIDISFFSDQKGLHFLVSDEGEGFDYSKYLQSDLIESPVNEEDSRGILIIKMLADEIGYNDSGRTIELIFYISSINYTLTLERKKHLETYFKNVVLYKA